MKPIHVVACRWVDEERLTQVYADVLASIGESLPTLVVYPGSIKRPCANCTEAVWVGPRQQKYEEGNPTAIIMCMMCAAIFTVQSGGMEPVVQLGNPYKPRDSER